MTARKFTTADLLSDPFFIGFDSIATKLHEFERPKSGNYPPYNIIKLTENRYKVEIAVAGFLRSEINVTVEDGILKVDGTKESSKVEVTEYLYKGIAERNFTRSFTLADTVEVVGADLTNGVLSITLENIIPEHKKPRTIAIGETQSTSDAQLLTEDK